MEWHLQKQGGALESIAHGESPMREAEMSGAQGMLWRAVVEESDVKPGLLLAVGVGFIYIILVHSSYSQQCPV